MKRATVGQAHSTAAMPQSPAHAGSELRAAALRVRRRPLVVAVVGEDAITRPLAFKVEVLGHDPISVRSGRETLELPASRVDVYLIDSDLPDTSSQSVAELIRLDPARSEAWVFGMARYRRPHREVSNHTAVFDQVLDSPVGEADLRAVLEQARMPRTRAGS